MQSDDIVNSAKSRLQEALILDSSRLPSHSKRWGAYAERIRSNIFTLSTCLEVLHFAQTKVGFEHRGSIHHEGKFTALYERELKDEFPGFADMVDHFADFENSAEETSYVHLGRPVSNVLFYITRIVLSCLAHLPTQPNSILEIGGGYGAPARLWLKNPIRPPSRYYILDVPESLFFSEVVLRTEFGEDAIHYIREDEDTPSEEDTSCKFVLCPLPLYRKIVEIPFDLVINTGSLQEMGETWVDFYQGLLDELNATWFYSLNYFAQPLNLLWESGNLYSPRLSPRWTARKLRWNPPLIRMQADRNYLEAFYEKDTSHNNTYTSELMRHFQNKLPSGDVFVEVMELARCSPNTENYQHALNYALRMRTIPKESLWLAEKLSSDLQTSASNEMAEVLDKLRTLRKSGIEEYY